MKHLLLAGAALAGFALVTAAPAFAEPASGVYGAVDVGYSFPNSINTGGLTPGNVRIKDDWMGAARLGYRFSPNWRVELEGAYRPGHLDQSVATGHFRSASSMANLLFDLMPNSRIHPFIGGGVGANFPMIGETFPVIRGDGPPGSLYVNSRRANFAWQGIGGLTLAASERLNIDLTYRYFDGSAETLRCAGDCPTFPVRFSHYRDHSVSLGLRYAFGAIAPPPPPPPPAPPAPVVEAAPPPPPPPPMAAPPPPPPPAFVAKSFIIYFPFDQSVVTPEAEAVVHDAAQYASQGHATQVVVVGHTDSSGSVAYNLRLSERRAKATADALVSQGIAQTMMKVDWKGKSELAVQTGDGVKEPLNRRSTVDINF